MSVAVVSPLRQARLEGGMSIEKLAAQAGVSASTVRLIENGWHGFKPETGRRIAAVAGLPPDSLSY